MRVRGNKKTIGNVTQNTLLSIWDPFAALILHFWLALFYTHRLAKKKECSGKDDSYTSVFESKLIDILSWY